MEKEPLVSGLAQFPIPSGLNTSIHIDETEPDFPEGICIVPETFPSPIRSTVKLTVFTVLFALFAKLEVFGAFS